MFYPGDPIEQRKRALIAKMAGGRGRAGGGRGDGGGGVKVGRPPGAGFGRGMGFGGGGVSAMGQRGQALPQLLGGYGVGGPGDNQGFGQGVDTSTQGPPQGPPGSEIYRGPRNIPLSFQGPTSYQGPTPSMFTGTQTAIMSPLIKQLLQGYGTAPQPQQQIWGGTNGQLGYY